MDKKPFIFWGIVVALVLLYPLSRLLPKQSYLMFSGNKPLGLSAPPPKASEVRGKAELPVPRRYIEVARQEVTRLMAEPGWQALSLEEKQSRLMQVFYQRALDNEYWAMPEARQRRMSAAFLQAFLGDPPGTLVDK